MFLDSYRPKSYGKEYFKINGSQQYPMFVAASLGIKPSFDDWIDVRRYHEFVDTCEKYGLKVSQDVIFKDKSGTRDHIVGGQNVTTTFQEGRPFDPDATTGKVHVYVAKKQNDLDMAKRFGWYSVVIKDRIINKPFVDHLRFGLSLGFPDCCIDFFRRFNDWSRFNHPYETFKNTPLDKSRPKASYLCNNHLMDKSYFFIHHLPCSYRCRKTMEYAKRVENGIREVEPDFVELTVPLLKKPLLIFGEKNFIIFDGKYKLDGKTEVLEYKDSEYYSNVPRIEDHFSFADKVKLGDTIRFDDKLVIEKDGKEVESVKSKHDWFMLDFE
jgi:hypothetical protein